jgi:hypothetical protein
MPNAAHMFMKSTSARSQRAARSIPGKQHAQMHTNTMQALFGKQQMQPPTMQICPKQPPDLSRLFCNHQTMHVQHGPKSVCPRPVRQKRLGPWQQTEVACTSCHSRNKHCGFAADSETADKQLSASCHACMASKTAVTSTLASQTAATTGGSSRKPTTC